MKALFATIAVALLSVSAQAANLKPGGYPMQVLKVSQFENRMPMIVDPGMPVPVRETYSSITAVVESCTTYVAEQFEVNVQTKENLQLVLVEPKSGLLDCMGPTHKYELTFSTTKLKSNKPVVILNSVPVELNIAY